MEDKESKIPTKKSLADEILNFDDERSEIVTVPEWGNLKVLCKNMTGADRALLGSMVEVDVKTNKARVNSTAADFVIAGCFNPDTGERLFTPFKREQLLQKNSAALERLSSIVQRLSGMSDDEARNIEKN